LYHPPLRLWLVLAKICPIWIPEFIRPEKIGYGQEFFIRIFNPDIKFFTYLLSESDFDPNLPSSELSDPEKTGYRISIFRPNFNIVRIVRLELDPNSIFCQRHGWYPHHITCLLYTLLSLSWSKGAGRYSHRFCIQNNPTNFHFYVRKNKHSHQCWKC